MYSTDIAIVNCCLVSLMSGPPKSSTKYFAGSAGNVRLGRLELIYPLLIFLPSPYIQRLSYTPDKSLALLTKLAFPARAFTPSNSLCINV